MMRYLVAATLRSEHAVVLDDKRRTWRVVAAPGAAGTGTPRATRPRPARAGRSRVRFQVQVYHGGEPGPRCIVSGLELQQQRVSETVVHRHVPPLHARVVSARVSGVDGGEDVGADSLKNISNAREVLRTLSAGLSGNPTLALPPNARLQWLLADHEVAANWGNWAYFSGVGAAPSPFAPPLSAMLVSRPARILSAAAS